MKIEPKTPPSTGSTTTHRPIVHCENRVRPTINNWLAHLPIQKVASSKRTPNHEHHLSNPKHPQPSPLLLEIEKRRGKTSQRGEIPTHLSNQKLVDLPFPTFLTTPSLNQLNDIPSCKPHMSPTLDVPHHTIPTYNLYPTIFIHEQPFP